MPSDKTRFGLDELHIPEAWYNVIPDLKNPPAPPKVVTPDGTELGPDQIGEVMMKLFPMECLKQESSPDRWIDIPGAVIDVYKEYRPSPLLRARQLEKNLSLPAGVRIYYKYEGVSPAGSHKPNTAIPQAYYNKQEGITKISTETGAGQWGSALSIAGALYGIDIEVFMVSVSYEQKPYRRILMETYGGTVHTSPSNLTDAGRHVLAMDPNSTGSLGIAISEAVEVAMKNDDTHYALGSVLNHVCLHQTIIGLEAIAADGARRGRARRRHRVRRRRLATSPASRSRTTTASSRARATRACSPSSPRRARRSPLASTATTSAMRRA